MTDLIDISPPITPGFPVWPGDTPPSREVILDMKRGDHLTLSTVHTSVHVGAHADAPNHYGRDAHGIERQPLDLYVGPCRVVRATTPRGRRVARADLDGPLDEARVLIATGSLPDPADWNDDFCGLEPDLVDALADAGVRLVGVDTPSVDLFTSKDLPAHARCLARDVAIIEGLVLADVAPGRYELIALPLPLVGFDASPVRAVLRMV